MIGDAAASELLAGDLDDAGLEVEAVPSEVATLADMVHGLAESQVGLVGTVAALLEIQSSIGKALLSVEAIPQLHRDALASDVFLAQTLAHSLREKAEALRPIPPTPADTGDIGGIKSA